MLGTVSARSSFWKDATRASMPRKASSEPATVAAVHVIDEAALGRADWTAGAVVGGTWRGRREMLPGRDSPGRPLVRRSRPRRKEEEREEMEEGRDAVEESGVLEADRGRRNRRCTAE
jgi:hypothetical protein